MCGDDASRPVATDTSIWIGTGSSPATKKLALGAKVITESTGNLEPRSIRLGPFKKGKPRSAGIWNLYELRCYGTSSRNIFAILPLGTQYRFRMSARQPRRRARHGANSRKNARHPRFQTPSPSRGASKVRARSSGNYPRQVGRVGTKGTHLLE